MPNPPENQPGTDTTQELALEDAIDALLGEAESACDRFENPENPVPEIDPFEDSVTEPEDSAERLAEPVAEVEAAIDQVEVSAQELLEQAADELAGAIDDLEPDEPDSQNEPEPAPGAETAAEIEPEPIAQADSASEVASNEDFLEGALDDLLQDESDDQIQAAEKSDKTPEVSERVTASIDEEATNNQDEVTESSADALDDAIGDLLGESESAEEEDEDPDNFVVSEELDTVAETDSIEEAEAAESATESSDQDLLSSDAFDALLDDDTSAGESTPNDSALESEYPSPEDDDLGSLADALLEDSTPEQSQPDSLPSESEGIRNDSAFAPELTPTAAVAVPDESAARSEPTADPPPGAEPSVTPAAAENEPQVPTKDASKAPEGKLGALVHQVVTRARLTWIWLEPRTIVARKHAVRIGGPLSARALMLMSKPLEGRPPKVRDSIGWVALWTAFLACCVWGWLMIRSPAEQPNDGDGTAIVSAEGTE
ncbi:MAG: hypothetical protein AB8F26_06065 [Phycisphaerales bacterium]